MLPYAVDLVSEQVHCEMEDAKPSLRMDIKEVTTEFAHSWHIDKIIGPVVEKTPTWSAILDAATESKEAKNKTKTTKSRNRRTVSGYLCVVVVQKLT
jgi:serine/threonine-protein kinase RIO1